MRRTKKVALFIAMASGFVLAAVSALIMLIPHLIDLQSVKMKTMDSISAKTGAVVQFDQVSLSYFPRISVTVSGVKAELPEDMVLQAEALNLYPSLLHLLSGKVQIAALQIQSPVIVIRTDREKPPVDEDIDARLAKLLGAVASNSPGLDVSVKNGVLRLVAGSSATLTVRDLEADADFGRSSTEIAATGSTDFIRHIKIAVGVKTKDRVVTRVVFNVRAKEIDVDRTREVILPVAGEVPAVRTVFSYLRAGLVPALSVKSESGSFRELGKVDNIMVRGDLRGGKVSVANTLLEFSEVSGTCLVAKGLLEAQNVTGMLGSTGLRNARLKVGIHRGDVPFHLEADAELTAEAAQQLLRRFTEKPAFPLDRLQEMKGMVAGRITLGDSIAALASWKEKGIFGFDGRIDLKDGLSAELALKVMPGAVNISRLRLQDAQSNAALSLNYEKMHIDGQFDGTLTAETLSKVIRLPDHQKGSVRGSISAVIDTESLTNSTFRGSLSIAGMPLLLREGLQLNIKSMDLRALPGIFYIDRAAVKAGDLDLELRGTIKPGLKDLVLDADLSSGRIDWTSVSKLWPHYKTDARKGQKVSEPFALLGLLRLSAGSFVWDRFALSPLRATIELSRERTTVTVNEAAFCGISAPGKIILEKDIVDLFFRPSAKDMQLLPAVTCLSSQKSQVSGTFSLEGNLKARGQASGLIRNLSGDISFSARNGGIDKAPVLSRVLAFIDVSEIFSGSIPDVGKEQFPYRSITVRGDLKNGKLLLRGAVMDAPAFELAATGEIDYITENVDIRLLAAPLSTLDSAIKKTPVVRDITGGALVAVPVHVTGNFKDLKTRYIPLSGIGSGLLGAMERTIKLPVSIFQPSAPAEK